MYIKREKSGVYKYRREYPAGLQAIIGAETFIHSLKTKDRKEADQRTPEAQREYEAVVERYTLAKHPIPADLQIPLLHELDAHRFIIRDKKEITLLELKDCKKAVLQNLRNAYEGIRNDGQDALVFSVASKKPGRTESALIMRDVYTDLLFRMENTRRITLGEPKLTQAEYEAVLAQELNVASVMDYVPARAVAPAKQYRGMKLSEALLCWAKKVEPQPKTLSDWSNAVRRFIELKGDLHIDAITPTEATEFRDAIQELPLIKSLKIRRKTLPELQKMLQEGKLDCTNMPSNRNINKYIDGLKAITKVALKASKGLENHPNPFAELGLKKIPKYKRVRFSQEDLLKLFGSPLYTGYDNSPPVRNALFWVPLIALYTGARLEEVAQLDIADIVLQDGINCIVITSYTGDKRVKNEGSNRTVPMHHVLILCGLLTYVEGLRNKGKERLFEELTRKNSEQRYGKNISKEFNAYLAELGIKPPVSSRLKKDFHSFRNVFITAAYESGVPIETRLKLVGHQPEHIIHEGYLEHSLVTLNKAMQQVEYPFLDFSGLYVN